MYIGARTRSTDFTLGLPFGVRFLWAMHHVAVLLCSLAAWALLVGVVILGNRLVVSFGAPNIFPLEYAFDLSPTTRSDNPVTPGVLAEEPGGDTFMTLTFPWADGMTDVEWGVETSPDLALWVPATAEVIATVQEGAVKILTVKVTPSVGGAETMFARLAVNKIAP